MKKIANFLFNRYVFCLLLSVALVVVLLHFSNKYTLSRISKQYSKYQIKAAYDLDNDGNSENLIYYIAYPNRTSIEVRKEGKVIEQWNFKGVFARGDRLFYGDYDKDGIDEIFIFTQIKDSIYFHILDAINGIIELENKPVCKIYKGVGDKYDYFIAPFTLTDANKDGYKEIYFIVSSGHAGRPRKLFAYFPVKNEILVSPESSAFIIYPKIFDSDKDGYPEFTVSVHAYGNTDKQEKFSDMYGWLMVFTYDLKFKFPPVHFDKFPARTHVVPFVSGNNEYLMVMHDYSGTDSSIQDFLALYDMHGKQIRKKINPIKEGIHFFRFFDQDQISKKVLVLLSNGDVIQIDSLLNIKKINHVGENLLFPSTDIDVKNDGQDEPFFIRLITKKMVIHRQAFKNLVFADFDEEFTKPVKVSFLEKKGEQDKILVDTGSYTYMFNYGLSAIYKFSPLLVILLYAICLTLALGKDKIKEYRFLKYDTHQKQIAELQMQSIQNQIDPHFTFNILTAFGSLIHKKDSNKANFLFKRYADLLRQTIQNSENVQVSLKDELHFVESYLDLEQFRYANKFSYEINMPEDIDLNRAIPRMLIHIFAENAVKHGLRHLENNGKLLIEGKRKKEKLIIAIRDNGIGRKKAKKYSNYSTGKGINIIKQILENYHKLFKIRIELTINDLYKDKSNTGTEVLLVIPYS